MKITIDEIRKLVEQELQKEDCWDGYERVPGSSEGSPGSCRKKKKLKEVEDTIKKMDNVTKHRDGDYIKEGSVIDDLNAATNLTRPKITLDPEEEENDDDLDPYGDEDVAESRRSYNRDTIRKMVEEEIEKLNEKPAKGKAKQKVTASGKKVSYGQAGKAKDGGPRVRKGTSKGDAYCARSLGIKKGLSKKKQNDPNTPNNLSRKRWGCDGAKSNK